MLPADRRYAPILLGSLSFRSNLQCVHYCILFVCHFKDFTFPSVAVRMLNGDNTATEDRVVTPSVSYQCFSAASWILTERKSAHSGMSLSAWSLSFVMIATCRVREGNSPLCGAAEKQMIVLGLVFSSVSEAHLGWRGFVSLLAVRLYYWDLDEMNLTPSSKSLSHSHR